jgi:methionyl-tRNA synthetase
MEDQKTVVAASKPAITYDDFVKLDIRVGTVVEVTVPDWSRKLLRFVVDFGPAIGKRVIFSGIQKWYSPEDFMGKQFQFLVNLVPKKMGEEESQGMMLMADAKDADGAEKPAPISLQISVENGTVIR